MYTINFPAIAPSAAHNFSVKTIEFKMAAVSVKRSIEEMPSLHYKYNRRELDFAKCSQFPHLRWKFLRPSSMVGGGGGGGGGGRPYSFDPLEISLFLPCSLLIIVIIIIIIIIIIPLFP